MIFKKENYKETWPFASGNVVSIIKDKKFVIAEINGKQYAMNGYAISVLKLPEVKIIPGKSIKYFRDKVKGAN